MTQLLVGNRRPIPIKVGTQEAECPGAPSFWVQVLCTQAHELDGGMCNPRSRRDRGQAELDGAVVDLALQNSCVNGSVTEVVEGIAAGYPAHSMGGGDEIDM